MQIIFFSSNHNLTENCFGGNTPAAGLHLHRTLNVCVYICINFLWNVQHDLILLTCSPSPPLTVSSLSVWEREWFDTAIWEMNDCFHCTVAGLRRYELSEPHWQYYQHHDWLGIHIMKIPWINYRAHSFSYLVMSVQLWPQFLVFLQCKLPRNIVHWQVFFCKAFMTKRM